MFGVELQKLFFIGMPPETIFLRISYLDGCKGSLAFFLQEAIIFRLTWSFFILICHLLCLFLKLQFFLLFELV